MKQDDATRFCSGEFPCEASTAAASLERERNDLEAQVVVLRAALERIQDSSHGSSWIEEVIAIALEALK